MNCNISISTATSLFIFSFAILRGWKPGVNLTPTSIPLALDIEGDDLQQGHFPFTNRDRVNLKGEITAEHRDGSDNFVEDREEVFEAGRKGGQYSGGNFKSDPERTSETGKKDGKNSHGGGRKAGDS